MSTGKPRKPVRPGKTTQSADSIWQKHRTIVNYCVCFDAGPSKIAQIGLGSKTGAHIGHSLFSTVFQAGCAWRAASPRRLVSTSSTKAIVAPSTMGNLSGSHLPAWANPVRPDQPGTVRTCHRVFLVRCSLPTIMRTDQVRAMRRDFYHRMSSTAGPCPIDFCERTFC